ncbi:MAG TPA: amino acid deaminase [Alphaproteobacteria bacterium]|nr:amino acid deaminase [Alphaproteobacteria bacterium]
MELGEIESSLLDGRTKGIPGGLPPFPMAAIGAKGWNVLAEDLPLPVCVLRQSALDHNGRWMRAFLEQSGAVISPHGKTTMSPQLFSRQIADGAWAITVGNVHQLQVARHYGCERIVLANQLVGRQGLRFVLDELARDPQFDFYCLVDSVPLVERMADAARAAGSRRPIQVFLEGGFAGGRTGVRNVEAARHVARAVKAAGPYLALRGVEGFEGLISGDDRVQRVVRFLDFLVELAQMIDREDLCAPGPLVLTAGGSAFYDIVVEKFRTANMRRKSMILTRSGCYLTHDSGMYAQHFAAIRDRSPVAAALGEPQAAMEVWAYVQSRPEATRALVTMGKRDVSFDQYLPVPLKWHRPGANVRTPCAVPADHRISALNDQHGYLDLPTDSPLQVGDLIGFGISHPCLTFDRWQTIMLVDDGYDVIGAIRTFF